MDGWIGVYPILLLSYLTYSTQEGSMITVYWYSTVRAESCQSIIKPILYLLAHSLAHSPACALGKLKIGRRSSLLSDNSRGFFLRQLGVAPVRLFFYFYFYFYFILFSV